MRHPGLTAEPDHLDFDGETQFDRWVQDPTGTRFHIQGLKMPDAPAGPILVATAKTEEDGNVFLRAINAILVRVQRPRTKGRCLLIVFRLGRTREQAVWHVVGDWHEGELEAPNSSPRSWPAPSTRRRDPHRHCLVH